MVAIENVVLEKIVESASDSYKAKFKEEFPFYEYN